MRVLIAPDAYAGTLSALDAATAMADGWRRGAPEDQLALAPMSDGGPGFVDVVHSAVGGDLLAVTVTGPLGEPVPGTVLLTDLAAGPTAYVESAQACGLHLVAAERRDPTVTSTVGVGELIGAAVDAGATRVVVGLGGSATNDGGAGALAALGAEPAGALTRGGEALGALSTLDLSRARARLGGVEVLVATDVDSPLLGPRGASNGFGPQKGADPDAVQRLDAALTVYARLAVGPQGPGLNMPGSPAVAPGAGAAGGLGYGLLCLGATRVPGVATVMDVLELPARVAGADVVLTGEGCLDWQSLRGKVVSGVAGAAVAAGRPCVVLAGRVEVGRRELAAMGVETAYAVTGSAEPGPAATQPPAEALAALAERVASRWVRRV